MLLKLIPASQEPTIHFSLSFAELPPTLPTPSAWTAQLSYLMQEDLEVPATLHSLDRAAGIPSLLEQVCIDIERKEIHCRYVDGSMEAIEFGLRGSQNEQKLMDALASIVRDVRESTLEDERVMQAREWERQKTRSASVSAPMTPQSKSGRQGKHKKQRSLFMHLVSCVGSIINLTSPSSSSHPSLPFYSRSNSSRSSTSRFSGIGSSDSPNSSRSNTPMVPTPGSSPKARALRRAARSALVDTFRRFILGELVRRFYAGTNRHSLQKDSSDYCYDLENHHKRERGGFCVWILHSMRRRALERMEQILEEAEPPSPEVSRFSEDVIPGFSPTTMDVPSSFSDEEDEELMVESPVSVTEFPFNAEVDVLDKGADTESASAENGSIIVENPENYPMRPSLNPRRASIASDSTDDSSESESIARSTSSMSTVSTAPSSVESESETKEDIPPNPPAKDVPLSLFRPQYSAQHPLGANIRHLSPPAKNEYTQLYELRTRLGQLAQFAASQSRVAASEVGNRLEVLSVRSRRRAWLNKALKGSLQAGVSGGSMFGLATPFRSSPLARYMFTASEIARRSSAKERSSCSSASSLSSAYFRTVSSISSASSVSSTKSTSPFPSSRPRLRPKIDYGAALAAAIVDFVGQKASEAGNAVERDGSGVNGLTTTTATSWDDSDADEDDETQLSQESHLSKEVKSRTRSRRHRRRASQEVMLPTVPAIRPKPDSDELFPVSEEMECQDEFTLALSARGIGQGQRGFTSTGQRGGEAFPGSDDIQGELGDNNHSDSDSEEGAADDTSPDLESVPDVDMDCVQDDLELGLKVGAIGGLERPQIRPRVRTTSMMGALFRGAKRSLGGGIKQQQPLSPRNSAALAVESLLCQPLAPLQSQPQQMQMQASRNTLTDSSILTHASNRRAMNLGRPPMSVIHAKTEIDAMDVDVEMNVNVHIDEYDYSSGGPHSLSKPSPYVEVIGFDAEAQHDHDEFTLGMDVPRRGASTRRRRDTMHYPSRHDPRRPKLNNIFHSQLVSEGPTC